MMNRKIQQWGSTRGGTIISGMKISETIGMFEGEIEVTKSVLVVNSAI
jgi:hypothetical protein